MTDLAPPQTTTATTLTFKGGLITLDPFPETLTEQMPWFRHDPRTFLRSAEARHYADTMLALLARNISVTDNARSYEKRAFPLVVPITPRPHQTTALDAWLKSNCRGVVQLPTGAGKTILAVMAIARAGRPALIVVPTIDLMRQWETVLDRHLGVPIGLLGGGSHTIEAITVATYDSAALHAERLGNRFGVLVFDECHHLPAPQYMMVALTSIAPCRLGLSATVARADGRESVIFDLIGPIVHDGDIRDMVRHVLAPYDVVNVEVPMTPDERAAYQSARAVYTDFLRKSGIRFSDGADWMDFVKLAARSPEGRRAMRAYRDQKRLANASTAKLAAVWDTLARHSGERVLVFTDDNALAYRIGREFILPVLTHQTRVRERKRLLDDFRAGVIDTLVTSRVLNEGVDVPEASVGIVVSGSGTVREHVQRLGRILRNVPGKRAILYEIVSENTGEVFVNQRRRQHSAYQGSS